MSDLPKAVVIGGGGFVGRALCRRLVAEGWRVTSISRSTYPELSAMGVEALRGDIASDVALLISAFDGARCVFHTAAKVEMWGPPEPFFAVNVQGTQNVIDACTVQRVPHLVFTSSPSVIANGKDLCGVDESIPYPSRHGAFYPHTKALAEQAVLRANSDSLATLSLRPHLIFGKGDNHFEPLIVKRAKQGRLVKIGKGNNVVSLCHIDDCVEAHMCAARALGENPSCRGKPYFITSGDVPLWEWINRVLARHRLHPVKRSVPAGVATGLGAIFDCLSFLSGYRFEPPFTQFLAEEMATHHYFSIEAAKKDLGYIPRHQDLYSW